ncbi:MAG: methyltransferase domain-containing protein [Kiritimatiellae bacterium]|nr:methyltransferase domain-containing protein [Kiritimatiellia bacterium]
MTPGRKLIDFTTKLLGRAMRHQRASVEGLASVKINLGCGLSVASGWINVDGSLNALIAGWPKPVHQCLYHLSGSSQYYSFEEYHGLLSNHRFIFHNLEHGLPFADQCADVVYSSHFIEHLTRYDGAKLLADVFRVLKPGGLCRISVPDLAFALSLYPADTHRMLDKYFFIDDNGSYFARHKCMYDYTLMKATLEQAGFKAVSRCAYRQGRMPDVELLDNRPEDSLFVEATRPL